MGDRRASITAGVRAVAPLLLGVVPFGLVAGVAAVDAGFTLSGAVGLSVVVFAGASQLAIVELVGDGAAPLVVVATALVVNLRYLMYSASIAPQFQTYSARWRAVLAYLLTDQAYALTVYREGDVKWYYVGAALGLWVTWQITTVLGVVVGARVPDSWQLTFAVPLTFLALVVPAVEERPGVAAAGVAAVVSVAAVGLPYNLGLLSGAVAGVAAGAVVALRTEDDPFAVAEGEP